MSLGGGGAQALAGSVAAGVPADLAALRERAGRAGAGASAAAAGSAFLAALRSLLAL